MFVLDVVCEGVLLVLLLLEGALYFRQLGLAGHSVLDDNNQLLLVLVFNLIDPNPGLVLNLLALLLVNPEQLVNLSLQHLALIRLLLLLKTVFNLDFLVLLLLQ